MTKKRNNRSRPTGRRERPISLNRGRNKRGNRPGRNGPTNLAHDPLNRAPPQSSFVHLRSTNLRIMTWNVDGFNDHARRLAITSHLWKHKVDIAVLTESHLLDEDIFLDPGEGKERIMRIQLAHYTIKHWHSRESSVTKRMWRCPHSCSYGY